jgi:iron complex outermembrane receptor protein
MRVFVILLSVIFFPIPIFADADDLFFHEPDFRQVQGNRLTGRILDMHTGQPLEGANVFIPDLKRGASTDQDGKYRLENIPVGNHLVEVSYVGYAAVSANVNVKGAIDKDFMLAKTQVEKNEIVITGVSHATQIRRVPVPLVILRKDELVRSASLNLIDVISRKPGVTQITTGPAISKPVIRGLGYNRLITVNDGIRQEGQQWGDEHGIEIDEYSAQKIEILKGPSSLMYGSDAMAGVINIVSVTTPPSGTVRGNIISNYQSNNSFRGTGLNLGGNEKSINWSVFGTYKAAADYRNKYDGPVYNSKFREVNFGGSLGYQGRWGYSQLIFTRFDQMPGIVEGERDDQGNFIKHLPGGMEATPTNEDFNSIRPQVPYQSVGHLRLVSDNHFNLSKGHLEIRVGFQNNTRREFGNPDERDAPELYFNLNTLNYTAIYHFQEAGNFKTSIGVNGMVQQNVNKGNEVLIPEYRLFDFGAFVYSQKNWDHLTISGGLRADFRSLHSDYFAEGNDVKFEAFSRTFSNLTGSVGFSYRPSRGSTFKFNIARGFRAPNIPELASNGIHEGSNRYEYGNRDLKSETSFQADLGFEYRAEHISLEGSLFYNDINHFIFYRKLVSSTGGGSVLVVDGEEVSAFKFNQESARFAGMEVVLDIHPHPLDWLHIENSFSLVYGNFGQKIEGVDHVPMVPAPRLISELRGDFLKQGKKVRNLSLKAELDLTFRQDRAFTAFGTETPTPAYALFNAGLGSDFVSGDKVVFSIYFAALNITDIAYQHHLSRLKYTDLNPLTGRQGVFNAGRNFSLKVNIPINYHHSGKGRPL